MAQQGKRTGGSGERKAWSVKHRAWSRGRFPLYALRSPLYAPHRTLLALLFAFSGLLPAQTADFLIIENPRELVVYDRFQQRINSRQEIPLAPYEPLQIIDAGGYLSDGFTPCIKVQAEHRLFFLLVDDNRQLVYAERAGFQRVFENCTLLRDTVEVLANQTLYLTHNPVPESAPRAQRFYLEKGERLLRLFAHRNRVYVRRIGGEPQYGWSNLANESRERAWRVYRRKAAVAGSIPPEIVQRIESRIGEANQVLAELFAHLNGQTGQRRAPPRWIVELEANRLRCILEGAPSPEAFAESARQLAGQLENALSGTPYRVSQLQNAIEVRRKE